MGIIKETSGLFSNGQSMLLVSPVSEDTASLAAHVAAQIASGLAPESGVAVNAGQSLNSADTPAIIRSLINPSDSGAAALQASLQPEQTSTDIRQVSGNRVNVRGGPGTDFGIVGKLVRGDAVEIIEDNGDGWVLMRPVDGGAEGWMADFLLTSG